MKSNMLISNIQWAEPNTDTECARYYGLPSYAVIPPHFTTPEQVKECLFNTYDYPAESYEISPDVTYSLEYSITESFSLTELCEELLIHPQDIDSLFVKWVMAYITLKDGKKIRHNLLGDGVSEAEPDYRWPIYAHVYGADGELLAEKQNPITLPLPWTKPSPEESTDIPSPSPSNSGDLK